MKNILSFAGQSQILSEYQALLTTVDAWFGRCMAAADQQIRCAKGCSGCCRGLFDISLLDARLLQLGFSGLATEVQKQVLAKAQNRLRELQTRWPDFAHPYLLNHMPDEEWTEMPEEDQTPCPLLGSDGLCLVYAYRPMTCRLHGLPNIDLTGEVFSDEWCTLNFKNADPLVMEELPWEFRAAFEREIQLFQNFTTALCGAPRNELDTFIPTALLIDFEKTDWRD